MLTFAGVMRIGSRNVGPDDFALASRSIRKWVSSRDAEDAASLAATYLSRRLTVRLSLSACARVEDVRALTCGSTIAGPRGRVDLLKRPLGALVVLSRDSEPHILCYVLLVLSARRADDIGLLQLAIWTFASLRRPREPPPFADSTAPVRLHLSLMLVESLLETADSEKPSCAQLLFPLLAHFPSCWQGDDVPPFVQAMATLLSEQRWGLGASTRSLHLC